MIIDVLNLSNMTHAVFHTVVEKRFSSKDVWSFP